MPIGEKLGKPFGFLSLISRKKKDEPAERLPQHPHAPTRSHHVSHAPRGHVFNPNPTNLPPSYVNASASASARAHSNGSANANIQYERLTPAKIHNSPRPGPAAIQYEPLRPNVRPPPAPLGPTSSWSHSEQESPSPMTAASTLSAMASGSPHPHRLQSPLQVEPSLPPPMMIDGQLLKPSSVYQGASPLVYDNGMSMRYDTSVSMNPAGGRSSGTYKGSSTPHDRGTPALSDKSTPFAVVMEEWMSQLRTPTPDVTLLPSPYDFDKDIPTPMEKLDGFKQFQEVFLPTPPPDVHDQNQNTKNSDYVLSASTSRRPLVEDIASLCRDLSSQDLYETTGDQKSFKTFPSPNVVHESTPRYQNTKTSASTPSKKSHSEADPHASQSSTKGKRRKMCTMEGCSNLSRSRGLCKAHGGGRRCSVNGCTRASQSGSLCITHGGGKRCTVDGCVKAAQSRGMCKAHGGGVRCRIDGCTKSSQGDGFCRTHGGGRRCGHPEGCSKWAQRNGMCMAHSEGKYGNSYRGRVHRMQDSTIRR